MSRDQQRRKQNDQREGRRNGKYNKVQRVKWRGEKLEKEFKEDIWGCKKEGNGKEKENKRKRKNQREGRKEG